MDTWAAEWRERLTARSLSKKAVDTRNNHIEYPQILGYYLDRSLERIIKGKIYKNEGASMHKRISSVHMSHVM